MRSSYGFESFNAYNYIYDKFRLVPSPWTYDNLKYSLIIYTCTNFILEGNEKSNMSEKEKQKLAKMIISS